jgi:membrane protease YdiL (CAAX protease family)
VRVPIRVAAGAWALAWVVGGVVLNGAVLAAMGADLGSLTITEIAVSSAMMWAAFAVALVVVSRRHGSGDLLVDYRVAVRPVDLFAIPAGVAAQLALIPALYWPLQQIWPDTFSNDELAQRAEDLVGRASGGQVVLLVVVVAVGAPLFEELVYRGLIQRSLSAGLGPWAGLLVAAAWFSLIHLAPVEYVGLFAAGLVFGLGLLFTDRLGPAVLAHMAFNVTGLVLAFRAG